MNEAINEDFFSKNSYEISDQSISDLNKTFYSIALYPLGLVSVSVGSYFAIKQIFRMTKRVNHFSKTQLTNLTDISIGKRIQLSKVSDTLKENYLTQKGIESTSQEIPIINHTIPSHKIQQKPPQLKRQSLDSFAFSIPVEEVTLSGEQTKINQQLEETYNKLRSIRTTSSNLQQSLTNSASQQVINFGGRKFLARSANDLNIIPPNYQVQQKESFMNFKATQGLENIFENPNSQNTEQAQVQTFLKSKKLDQLKSIGLEKWKTKSFEVMKNKRFCIIFKYFSIVVLPMIVGLIIGTYKYLSLKFKLFFKYLPLVYSFKEYQSLKDNQNNGEKYIS